MSGMDRGLRNFRGIVFVEEGTATDGEDDFLVSSDPRDDCVLNTDVILSLERLFLCA